jgi:signal transduction histidine kinase
MNVLAYLKERWMFLSFLVSAFLFAFLVYRLDAGFSIRASNAAYILMGWGLLFLAFFLADFYAFRSRARKFRSFCKLHATSEASDEFYSPADREKAELVRELALEYDRYKAENETKSAEEMDFITKWLHDVKVPIAAARLILESQQDKLPGEFYNSLYSELFSIEESTMKVFYEMKSNRFFDDFRIAKIGTDRLIAQALKGYSSFFSYKKLCISVMGGDFEVRTDEKWSSYILSQIISNAIKYTPDGGSIEIRSEKDERSVSISIKNQGNGILPQDIERIFQKGFTSTEDRQGAKSTGYGLYLSKKLSDLLGHSLDVESEPGIYAAFRLTFHDRDSLYRTKM